MSRENKQPYVRFFASDWLAGTRGMKASEVGVYITLIALMYERCEPLPEDHSRLARQCGCTVNAFRKVLSVLLADHKIIKNDAGLWNKRVEQEFTFREKKSHTAREAVKAREEKRKQINSGEDQTIIERSSNDHPNQKPESKVKEEPNGSSKKGCRLNEDWNMPTDWCELAVKEGLTKDQVRYERDQFKDWFLSAPGQKGVKLDWKRTWMNWVRKSVRDRSERRRGNQNQLPLGTSGVMDEIRRQRGE